MHLVEPFQNPAFGSPADVQRSVSHAITIFCLWKKVFELKKIQLHSQPGASSNPFKRAHFLTHGCNQTVEIQFAAASPPAGHVSMFQTSRCRVGLCLPVWNQGDRKNHP